MTTQSRMFFVKSFKGFRPLVERRLMPPVNLHQAKLHGQQYISGLRAREASGLTNFDLCKFTACGPDELLETRTPGIP